MSQPEAKAMGAMALFGEKYGDRVRVVSVGEWAHELCGGTHVSNTGRLGLVKLLHESSIGAGVRRVEALVGADAYNFLAREHVLLAQVSELVKARPEELPERIAGIVGKLRDAEKEIASLRAGQVLAVAGELAGEPAGRPRRRFCGAPRAGRHDRGRPAQARVRRARPARLAPGGHRGSRAWSVISRSCWSSTNEASREQGLKAGALAKIAAVALGGGGGGKDDVAQGGGTDVGALDAALEAVRLQIAGTVPA